MAQAVVPGLLRLPVELRLQIYEIIFDRRQGYYLKTHLSILAVCQQIREEALPIILGLRHIIHDLPNFVGWVSQGKPRLLQYLRDVYLTADDKSWKVLLEQLDSIPPLKNEPIESQGSTGDWWEREYVEMIKQHDAEKLGSIADNASKSPAQKPRLIRGLWTSLQAIQPVKRLMIPLYRKYPSPDQESKSPAQEPRLIRGLWTSLQAIQPVKRLMIHLYRKYPSPDQPAKSRDIEQELFLNMVSTAIPSLEHLTLHTNLVDLDFLRNLQSLNYFQFSGYSLSNPDDTLGILRSLPNLKALNLQRYPRIYDRDNYSVPTSDLPNYLSITPMVIKGLNPLSIFKITHLDQSIPSPHMTLTFLKAVITTHRESLRSLSLFYDYRFALHEFYGILGLLSELLVEDLFFRFEVPKLENTFDISPFLPSTLRNLDGCIFEPKNTFRWELCDGSVKRIQ
ncbi:hypothetical protein FQN53_003853 [Emmonsiellopsis sp. PD_33]|nr:hypothetical protein FQN53_003853 [Emmonsiellopsis sp. PD_33]